MAKVEQTAMEFEDEWGSDSMKNFMEHLKRQRALELEKEKYIDNPEFWSIHAFNLNFLLTLTSGKA